MSMENTLKVAQPTMIAEDTSKAAKYTNPREYSQKLVKSTQSAEDTLVAADTAICLEDTLKAAEPRAQHALGWHSQLCHKAAKSRGNTAMSVNDTLKTANSNLDITFNSELLMC